MEMDQGVIFTPLIDQEHVDNEVYAQTLIERDGIGIYIHKQKPEYTTVLGRGATFVDQTHVMCSVYLEFYDGKIQVQIYDQQGEQYDTIHWEIPEAPAGFDSADMSIVLIKDVSTWKPETGGK